MVVHKPVLLQYVQDGQLMYNVMFHNTKVILP